MRFILSLLLLLALAAHGAAATVTVALATTSPDVLNKVTQAAVASSQNTVTITVADLPRIVCVWANTAWKYRSTDSTATTDAEIAAGQPLVLKLQKTTTFYHLRQSADGTLFILPLE